MSEGRDRFGRFMEHLERLRDREDRGALAALRRGVGRLPGDAPEMFPYVIPFIEGSGLREENRFFLVGALFAWHPEPGGEGNMGQVFKRIAWSTESDSVERRFVAMLNADQEDLPHHLRQAVSLARSCNVPVNWRQLFRDMTYWNHDGRFVQREWARSFWSAGGNENRSGQERKTADV